MQEYYICGFRVHIDCISQDFMDMRCKEYEKQNDMIFDGIEDRDIYIKSYAVQNIETPVGNIIHENNDNLIVENDGNIICIMKLGDINVMKITYFDNYKRTEIEIIPYYVDNFCELTVQDLEYLYIGGAFALRVGVQGGIMIHSSCISFDGDAVLFSAPSGTGKSTHTALWAKCFPKNVVYINDDKPIVMFKNGHPYACGTPFSGKTDINHNIIAPIKAYVYLDRGQENTICKSSIKESIAHLLEQTIKTNIDHKIYLRNLDAVEKIVSSVSCYNLFCLPNEDAVYTVKKEIFDENK